MRDTVTGYTREEHNAIERFLASRTVPLCCQHEGRAFVQGTGTFYRTRGRLLLVTAAHVLDGIDPSKLGIPDKPYKDVGVWNLNDITIHHPKDKDNFDAAIIEFLNPNFVERVASQWQCIEESEVVSPADGIGEFLVAGYPSELVEDKNGVLTPKHMLQLFTKVFVGEDATPTPQYDLLLKYSKNARSMLGDPVSTPRLGGISGAAVYARTTRGDRIWSPEEIFRPVGLQVSMKHDEYIRVKRWSLVQDILALVP